MTFSISQADRRAMLNRLMIVWGVAFIIVLTFWTKDGFGWSTLVRQTVYTYSISTLIWFFLDVGKQFFVTDTDQRWPTGWRLPAFLTVSILAGYAGGTAIGDWYVGRSIWELHSINTSRLTYMFLVSIAISLGFIGYFYQREMLSAVQRQAAESQLKLLETQLEPHMLFNTLANLRVLISTDPARATVMLDHMVAYLRATLGGSRAVMHPLQLEFDRLGDYLELMAIRMGPRLRYSLDLPTELANHPVPPLLLQPLVENAIKHGLEPKVEGGSIKVAARLQGNQVVLEVSDTGVGCSQASGDLEPKGFGLSQVAERLATTYGPASTITFVADEAYSTLARVVFPYQKTP
jgi:signal transduction histidine kinase